MKSWMGSPIAPSKGFGLSMVLIQLRLPPLVMELSILARSSSVDVTVGVTGGTGVRRIDRHVVRHRLLMRIRGNWFINRNTPHYQLSGQQWVTGFVGKIGE